MQPNLHSDFQREIAFSRTIGFVTKDELNVLKNKTIAVAGLGGVGGSHLVTLTRLGIGGFNIADMDTFGQENFNRQAGATMNTIGKTKVNVLKEMILAINPQLRIKTFPSGVDKSNIDEFLNGVDIYLDGLDFFAFNARKLVFNSCENKKIPAVTVGPVGMGAALINFLPGQMPFEKYFDWKDSDTELELAAKFLVGLSPKAPHRHYLVDQNAVDFKNKKGPSTPMGCELCAGVAGTEVLKILLGRSPVLSAPHSIVFDGYFNRVFHSYNWFGNRSPLQKIKIAVIKNQLNKMSKY